MIKIDGNYGEGGGQILRTAVGLSAATGKPCEVNNIRKGRKKPGLSRSHLATLKAIKKMTNAELKGAEIGSTAITFKPGGENRKEIRVDIKTAGSITLVLHGLLIPAALRKNPLAVEFVGGATDTFFSPTIDHFRYVFLKILQKSGIEAEVKIKKRGFYPQGNAHVLVKIKPAKNSKLKPITLKNPRKLQQILVISGASRDLKKKKVAERQASGTKQVLSKLQLPVEEKVEYYEAESSGSQLNIIARLENTVFGRDKLGKMGKSSEEVGKEAAREFLEEVRSQACLDQHTADQILPYLALASGKSEVKVSRVTPHCRTNMWVIEKFLDGRFEVKDNLIAWQA